MPEDDIAGAPPKRETMDKDEGQSKANIIMVTDGPAIPNPRERRLINAWSIALTGAILSLLLLCYAGPSSYREALLFLPDGILLTFKLTALAIELVLEDPRATVVGDTDIHTTLVAVNAFRKIGNLFSGDHTLFLHFGWLIMQRCQTN